MEVLNVAMYASEIWTMAQIKANTNKIWTKKVINRSAIKSS